VRQQTHALFEYAIMLSGIQKESLLRRGLGEIRVLVAFEDDYRVYRDVIASAISISRPHIEVATAGLGTLTEEMLRFDPQMVVCSLPNTLDPTGKLAWVELSLDSVYPARVYLAGRYSERRSHPALEMLLEVIDEAEEIVRTTMRLQSR
jgi:hypothetical protein